MKFNIIYKTTNLINGKIYVGKHVQKCCPLAFDGYLGSGVILKSAIRKYGRKNFIRDILDVEETEELAYEKEIYWISKLNSNDPKIGYNISKGGDGNDSEFARQNFLRLWKDKDFRENMLNSRKISNNSIHTKQKRSESTKKLWQSENYRNQQIQSAVENWKDEEYRNKVTEAITIALNRPEVKAQHTAKMERLWSDEEYRERTIKSQTIAQNKPELLKRKSAMSRGSGNPRAIFHYVIKDPTGIIYQTDCITEFAKTFGLDKTCMIWICSGKRKHHKGWTCVSKTIREEFINDIGRGK